MIILLKGELHPELVSLGLKPGDEISANKCPVSKVGAMHFSVSRSGTTINCTVWPENYIVLTENFAINA